MKQITLLFGLLLLFANLKGNTPSLIDFNKVESNTSLLLHWKLDEEVKGAGFIKIVNAEKNIVLQDRLEELSIYEIKNYKEKLAPGDYVCEVTVIDASENVFKQQSSFSIDYPDCTIPTNVLATKKGSRVTISWEGIEAGLGGVSYELKVKKSIGSFNSKKHKISLGRSYVLNLNNVEDKRYLLRKVCYDSYLNTTNYSDWVEAELVESSVNKNDDPIYFDCNEFNGLPVFTDPEDGVMEIIDIPELPDPYAYNITASDCFNGTSVNIVYNPKSANNNSISLNAAPWNQLTGICSMTASVGYYDENNNWVEVCDPLMIFEDDPPTIATNGCDVNIEEIELVDELTSTLEAGDIIYISYFPISTESLTQTSSGHYTGDGNIVIPFSDEVLYVTFSNVAVNTQNFIISGFVNTVTENPVVLDDPSFIIGGPICVPPPENMWNEDGTHVATGDFYDPNGFDENGNYILETYNPMDSLYDPNGFDSEGNYINGGIYNENGCSQDSLTAEGQPCDPGASGPYWWLQDNPTSQAGIAFVDSLGDSLRILIHEELLRLSEAYGDIIQLGLEVDSLRNRMRVLVNDELQYEHPELILGVDDKYIEKDMHKHFSSAPKILETNVTDRNPLHIELEETHVQLYEKDKLLFAANGAGAIIAELLTQEGLDATTADIREIIIRLDEEEIAAFKSDFNQFITWLHEALVEYINEIYEDSTTGYLDRSIFNSKILSTQSPLMEDLASLGEEIMELEGFKPLLMSDHYDLDNDYQKAMYLQDVLVRRKQSLNNHNFMPHEFTKEIGGKEYTIILDNMSFSPEGGITDAYFIYEEPSEGNTLVFKGENIGFRPDGLVAESRLMLLSDMKIRLSNNMRLLLNGQDELTYVSWDCAGFKEFSISAGIEFCRAYLTPLDSITMEPITDEEEHVIGSFKSSFVNWGDFVAQVDVNYPFYVTGYEQLKWKVENATFDMSDYHSAIFQFPSGYNHPFVGSNHQAMPQWKGMHMELLDVTIGGLGNDEFDNPVSLGVTDLIVDSRGFTGGVYVAYPFLSLDDGNMGGWAYSIDTIQVDFMANHLKGGGFMGNINVPALKGKDNPIQDKVTEEDCFKYAAHICRSGDVSFEIHNTNEYTVPMWVADITLRPESHLKLEVRDGNFEASAMLHGSINMDGQFTEAIHLTMDSIDFQGLQIANRAPYFNPGIWGFPDLEFSMAGFGVSLSDVSIDAAISTEPQMRFKAGISLASLPDDSDENKEKTGLTAEGSFGLFGKLEFQNDRQRWRYDDFQVYGVQVDCEYKGNKLKGGIMFYEDAMVNGINWGTGFRGGIQAKFKVLGEVAAVAQFGAIKNTANPYKYFFVDALVNFSTPLALGSSGVSLKGFGGGLYYHMSRDTTVVAESIPVNPFEPTVDVFAYGESLSKTLYIPNPDIFVGLKANVILATTAEVVFNANLGFEIAFNALNADGSGGGIANIYLNGNGRFLELPNYGLPPVKSMGTNPYPGVPLTANAEISYNFNEDVLDGFLEVYMDMALIRGRYNTKMGRADLRFADDGWFINIGTPHVPLGIDLDLSFPDSESSLLTVGLDAYLNVGTHIPPMKELPDEVKSVSAQFSKGDPFRTTGQGIVFGASLDIQTPDLSVTPFYGSFNAAAGFDMMIKDYGETYCTNLSNTVPVGFNGWYCSGQMYAFVDGEIGLSYKGSNFKILDIGAVAVLKAKLPNPMYAEGYLQGQYKILGGLVSGSCNFRMELGEPCDLSSEPASNAYIVDINPFEGSSAVPVNSRVNTRFAVPITDVFEYEGSEFSFEIEESKLTRNGLPYYGKTKFNSDGTIFTFEPFQYLQEEDTFQYIISLNIFENGQLLTTESDTIDFVTGKADKTIHSSNVKAAYPYDGMVNYYKNQLAVGNSSNKTNAYIELYKNMPNLFSNTPDDVVQKIIISDRDGNTQFVDFEYEILNGTPTVRYLIDPEQLINEKLYKIEFVSIDVDYYESLVAESSTDETSSPNLPGIKIPYNSSVVNVPQINAGYNEEELKEIHYEAYFRVSAYNSFLSKIDDYKSKANSQLLIQNVEPFSTQEINSFGLPNRIIRTSSELLNSTWFNEEVFPIIYEPFPDQYVTFDHKTGNSIFPEVRPTFNGSYYNAITKELFLEQSSLSINGETKIIGTNIVDIITGDMFFANLQINKYIIDHPDPDPLLMDNYYPLLNYDLDVPASIDVKVQLNYYLPGKTNAQATVNWIINAAQ